MANSLGRELKVGDKIVVFGVECVVDLLTFGAHTFTSGGALGVTVNGRQDTIDAREIDKAATEARFAKDNGWL